MDGWPPAGGRRGEGTLCDSSAFFIFFLNSREFEVKLILTVVCSTVRDVGCRLVVIRQEGGLPQVAPSLFAHTQVLSQGVPPTAF